MKTTRGHHHHKSHKAGTHQPRPMNEDQLNQQLQTMLLDDEWNASWDDTWDVDGRDYKTVDED